ncbi:MAG: hypothetical protein ACOZEN_07545 [Thermodesulfobacteriota bacterium]
MFDFIRTLREKDINSTNLRKNRRWLLTRGDRTVRFKGKLLSFYDASADCLDPEAQNKTRLETIAIFRTLSRYLIYYVLEYLNNEHISGKQVHLHATSSIEGAERFIGAMTYVNRKSFAQAIIEDARAADS